MEKLSFRGMNILQSKRLLEASDLVHGFTTRQAGDINLRLICTEKWQEILTNINSNINALVGFEQIHRDQIIVVRKKHFNTLIAGTDGGVTKEKGVILGVNTADCLPILFFDSKEEIVGAIHAGWNGVFNNIVSKTINRLIQLGSKAEHIQMVIGPHIGGCCYTVNEERAKAFTEHIGNRSLSIYKDKNGLHLDLASIVTQEARISGLLDENLDIILSCTACQHKTFFSYRYEGSQLSGEMLSFIGLL